MPQSLRFALRRWRTRPGLAIVAIVILAIGIGTTTAMFSLVNAVLLTEEPWPHADRLVRIFAVQPQQRNSPAFAATWNRGDLGWASWRDVQRAPFVADAAAWLPDQQIVGDNQTELVQAMYASSTLPSLLGARPEAGRFFTAEEDEADSGTVIISHRLWARLFGSDPDVVGKVTLVTRPGSPAAAASRRAIVGVLPAGLVFPGDEPDILLPIGVHKYNGSFAPNRFLKVIARLEADADVGAVASAVEPLVRREEPAERRTSRVVTLREDRVGIGDASLWLMFAGAALLLVVACSNVAGLLLSDARSRRHETAVRLALGGSRFAILRALMVEHGVLAIVAAVAGVLLASWLIPVLSALAPAGLIGDQAVRLDPRIAGWAIAASIVTTLVAGLVPATTISSARPTDSLKGGARELTRGSRWRHRSIVAAQFGLALVLLVGAGLFGETLIRLGRRPLGFSPEGVVIVGVSQTRPGPAPPISPEERERLRQDYYAVRRDGDIVALNRLLYGPVWTGVEALMSRIATLPGVRAVAATDSAPYTAAVPQMTSAVASDQPADQATPAVFQRVSARYFDTMGIAVRRGRTFNADDGMAGNRVVISETLERRLFGGDGLGKKIGRDRFATEVVGIVSDVRQSGRADEPAASMYAPLAMISSLRQFIVRTEGDVATLMPQLRSMIEHDDKPLFVTSIQAFSETVGGTMKVERSRALLSSAYGGIALLLATVGLYGLAARLVAERRKEIGVRVALGAAPRDVRRLVMVDAWLIVAIGLVVGIPTAVVSSKFAEGLLYGVSPSAPHVVAVAVLALTLAALAATIIPSWRANRVDPVVVLRED